MQKVHTFSWNALNWQMKCTLFLIKHSNLYECITELWYFNSSYLKGRTRPVWTLISPKCQCDWWPDWKSQWMVLMQIVCHNTRYCCKCHSWSPKLKTRPFLFYLHEIVIGTYFFFMIKHLLNICRFLCSSFVIYLFLWWQCKIFSSHYLAITYFYLGFYHV